MRKNVDAHKLLIGSVLSLSLLLSGCQFNGQKKKSTINLQPIATSSQTSNQYAINKGNNFFNRTSPNLKENHIYLSNNGMNVINNYLKNYSVTYDFQDIYNIDGIYEIDINQIRSSIINQNTESLKFSSVEELKNVVLNNNQLYLEKLGANKAFYHELDNETLTKLCEIILESIQYEAHNSNISIADINDVLSNLKIFQKTMGSNACVTEEDVLCINDSMIKSMGIIHSDETDVYKSIIIHESYHLIEKNSYTSIVNNGIRINGGSTYFLDHKINPLSWTWLSEACAEQEMSNRTGNNTMTYDYMIGYLNSLKLVTMFFNNSTKDIEQINLSKDLNGLLQKFNVNSYMDKVEFYNMMYSLEIIEKEEQGFINMYKELYGIDLKANSVELKKLKFNLKTSICLSLTKYFYNSLAAKISQDSMSLSDIFYLNYIFESDLNVHLNLYNSENIESYNEFINQYSEIQSKFFEIIAQENGIDLQQIITYYNEYGIACEDGTINYTLENLSEKQIDFINNNITTYQKNATPSIASIVLNEYSYQLKDF